MAKDALDAIVRANLKKFRELAGLSQVDAAELSGVNLDNLRRYESGKTEAVPGTVLSKLSAVYGHSVGDFFSDQPPPARLDEAPVVFLRTRPGVEIDADMIVRLQKIVDDANREIRVKRRR